MTLLFHQSLPWLVFSLVCLSSIDPTSSSSTPSLRLQRDERHSLRQNNVRRAQEETTADDNSYTRTKITDFTFKPLIKECLSELPDDPNACDKMAHWDVGKVTDCSLLFWEALNENTHDYKISPGAEHFNVNISRWDTSSCTTMKSMFHGAYAFNAPIGDWDTGKVTDMSHMFQGATNFNQDISRWNTANVTNMAHMFRYSTNFHNDRLHWDTGKVRQFSYMFLDTTKFNGHINDWNIKSASDHDSQLGLVAMFDGAKAFNQPLNSWDVSRITRYSFMFQSALAFNQDLSDWDIRLATDFTGMFHEARSFNQTLCWDMQNTSRAEKVIEGTLPDTKIDGNFTCRSEKLAKETSPPTSPPMSTGHGVLIDESVIGTGAPAQDKEQMYMLGQPMNQKESEAAYGDQSNFNLDEGKGSNNQQSTNNNSNNSNPQNYNRSNNGDDALQGVRWELVLIALLFMAVIVLALQLKREKSKSVLKMKTSEQEYFDRDLFQERHGRNERFEDEPDHQRKRIFDDEEDYSDHAPREGAIDYDIQGPVDIFSEAFDVQQLKLLEGSQNAGDSMSLEQQVNALEEIMRIEEEAGLSLSQRRQHKENKKKMRESMKRLKSLKRHGSQRSTNKSGAPRSPNDLNNNGEISFDGASQEEAALWTRDELGGQQLSFDDGGDRQEMPLEHAVAAMEAIIRAESLEELSISQLTSMPMLHPDLNSSTVDVDAMEDYSQSILNQSASTDC